MSINTYIISLIRNWSKAFTRFPLFLIGCAVVCFYFSYLQYDYHPYSSKIALPLVLGLGGIFLVYLIIERFQLSGIRKWLAFSMAIGFALLYYICLPAKEDYHIRWPEFTFLSILLSFHLAYCVILFLNKKDESGFLRYNINVIENFTESSILCLILFGLLTLALYALKTLFGLPFSGRSTMHLFIWIAGFVHSINFLSAFPSFPIQEATLHKYNTRFYKILVLYISIPVMIIYSLITMAYIIKMFLGGNYEPWITTMCGWYIGIGLVVYLFNRLLIKDNESLPAQLFDKYFPLLSIPIVALFIYCTFKNINEEGVNTSNYYSILMSLVSAIIFGLLTFKKDFNLVWIPCILLFATLFSIASGPLNVWTYPLVNQKARLVKALQNEGVIKNGAFDFKVNISEQSGKDIEKSIYAIEFVGDLNFLKIYDKDNVLSDSLLSYQFMEKLNFPKGQSSPGMNNKYYDFVPIIKLKEGNQIYPIVNKYVNTNIDYSGLKVGHIGNILVFENGMAIDSISISLKNINQQNITSVSQIKKDTFDLYITNLTYASELNKCKVEDFNGIVVKR